MNKIEPLSPERFRGSRERRLSRSTVFLLGDLLPLCDFTSVLLAAYLGALVYFHWIAPAVETTWLWNDGARAALAAAVLAPFILCDRAFVSFANDGQTAALVRCYCIRFLILIGVVSAIGLSSRSLASLPHAWLTLWLVTCLVATMMTRLVLVRNLRRLERKGALAETVAIVGSGPAADRLILHLQQMRPNSIKIVGVFDDRSHARASRLHQPTGTIADLLDIGKKCSMDWILLTLPGSAEVRVHSIVHRLKPLAVPIGLCPQNAGFALPGRPIHYIDNRLAVIRLADRPITRWHAVVSATEVVLPHWLITLLGLPASILKSILLSRGRRTSSQRGSLSKNLVCTLDHYDLEGFTKIATHFGSKRFGYVVTPNADHLIRLHREPAFQALYADAAYILLDSRFISRLLRFTKKLELPVCTGSDLTARLFRNVIKPNDKIVLVGGTNKQAACLRRDYGVQRLAHFNPPMGFIHDPAALESCLQFIESQSPFRYCLLAVGSPQQEIVAQRLKARGVALGMALCIGASINFLTGDERRAPLWIQSLGMEWLFRLSQAPGRMARRYLLRGPQLFGLLRHTDILVRHKTQAAHSRPASALIKSAEEIQTEIMIPPVQTYLPAARAQNKHAARSR